MNKNSLDNALDSEKLLEHGSDSFSQEDVDEFRKDRKFESRQLLRYKFGGIILILLLVATNLGWYWGYHRADHVQYLGDHSMGPPELTYFLDGDDPDHVLIPFEHDWQELELIEEDGYRYGDVHWETKNWVPHGGATVALSKQFVEENNLFPGAAPLEENATEFHYLVAGYHQLHCLREVRDAIYFLNGTLKEWPGKEPFQWDHIIHCIEAVRQGIHCGLDPTLIPLDSYWPGIQNDQLHVCRNRDALFKWTSEFSHLGPKFNKQAPPARSQEWYRKTKGMVLPPWQPDPAGPPVEESMVN